MTTANLPDDDRTNPDKEKIDGFANDALLGLEEYAAPPAIEEDHDLYTQSVAGWLGRIGALICSAGIPVVICAHLEDPLSGLSSPIMIRRCPSVLAVGLLEYSKNRLLDDLSDITDV